MSYPTLFFQALKEIHARIFFNSISGAAAFKLHTDLQEGYLMTKQLRLLLLMPSLIAAIFTAWTAHAAPKFTAYTAEINPHNPIIKAYTPLFSRYSTEAHVTGLEAYQIFSNSNDPKNCFGNHGVYSALCNTGRWEYNRGYIAPPV